MSASEVAQFRQQQTTQEEAALLGLYGLASVSRHTFIETRMQRGAEHILQLIKEGKGEEAQQLMNTNGWGKGDLERIEEE